MELFILLGNRIFRGLKPGSTRKELTRIVLSSFSYLLFFVLLLR